MHRADNQFPKQTVSLFVYSKGDKKEHSKVTTDANGSVVIDKADKLRWLTASKGNDVALPLQNINTYRYSYAEAKKKMS